MRSLQGLRVLLLRFETQRTRRNAEEEQYQIKDFRFEIYSFKFLFYLCDPLR
jgi:hypothetical protein